MKLKVKDIIAISIVTVASFPVLYLIMLFVTGSAHIEFTSPDDEPEKKEKVQLMKQSLKRDSLLATQSRTFQAIQVEKKELEKERKRLREQQDRINLMQSEVEIQRKQLTEEREKIEKLVESSDSLSLKKIKKVAKVYGAMKPAEAATILSTMDEKLVASILQSINDDRQKAKIMSRFSPEKAARLSRIIGGKR